jgi:phosphoribosyl-ATP pyrophosphohydrolase
MAKLTKKAAAGKPKGASRKPKKVAAATKRTPPMDTRIVPVNGPLAGGPDAAVLDRLWSVVMSRRTADPTVSHSARLLSRGTAKVAQKFGEEAVECVIEAVLGNKDAVIAESADVLYHLLVVWVASDVAPREVWAELERREGISGVAEKASRVKALSVASGVETKKIP